MVSELCGYENTTEWGTGYIGDLQKPSREDLMEVYFPRPVFLPEKWGLFSMEPVRGGKRNSSLSGEGGLEQPFTSLYLNPLVG